MEWVIGIFSVLAVWMYFAFNVSGTVPDYLQRAFLPLPLLLILIFGFVSLGIVIYRTLTFNDCPEAAEELKKQISEARRDLESRGMKFESKKDN